MLTEKGNKYFFRATETDELLAAVRRCRVRR